MIQIQTFGLFLSSILSIEPRGKAASMFVLLGFENEPEKGSTATAVTINDRLLPFSIHLSTLVNHVKYFFENFNFEISSNPLSTHYDYKNLLI